MDQPPGGGADDGAGMRAIGRPVVMVCLALSTCSAVAALSLTLAGFGSAQGDMLVSPSGAGLPLLLAVVVLAVRHLHSPRRPIRADDVTRLRPTNRT
jgi:hypothetical protein